MEDPTCSRLNRYRKDWWPIFAQGRLCKIGGETQGDTTIMHCNFLNYLLSITRFFERCWPRPTCGVVTQVNCRWHADGHAGAERRGEVKVAMKNDGVALWVLTCHYGPCPTSCLLSPRCSPAIASVNFNMFLTMWKRLHSIWYTNLGQQHQSCLNIVLL
jgi:hypothetical protein